MTTIAILAMIVTVSLIPVVAPHTGQAATSRSATHREGKKNQNPKSKERYLRNKKPGKASRVAKAVFRGVVRHALRYADPSLQEAVMPDNQQAGSATTTRRQRPKAGGVRGRPKPLKAGRGHQG
jgi:hypothetical protein